MTSLIVGVICLFLGIVGIFAWGNAFLTVLKGVIPLLLILIGALALFLGFDTLKEKSVEKEPEEEESAPETPEGKE